jgi:hypothetical protein
MSTIEKYELDRWPFGPTMTKEIAASVLRRGASTYCYDECPIGANSAESRETCTKCPLKRFLIEIGAFNAKQAFQLGGTAPILMFEDP